MCVDDIDVVLQRLYLRTVVQTRKLEIFWRRPNLHWYPIKNWHLQWDFCR